jgi:hypothetical protein
MRSFAILSAVLLSFAARAAEQKVKKSEVPAAVLASVQKKYPSAKLTGFEKDTAEGRTSYEVKVKNGKDRLEVSLDPEGKILTEESEISLSQVPETVKKALASSKYGSWKVQKTEKIVEGEDEQKLTYEFILAHGGESAEAVFDPQGKLIKEEAKKAEKR